MERKCEGPGVYPGQAGQTGPGVVGDVQPAQPLTHGDLLQDAPDWSVMSILSSDWSILTGPGPRSAGCGSGRGSRAASGS